MQPIAVTMADAAKLTGLGKTKLYELIGAGSLDARKQGKRVLILTDSIRKHLESLPKVTG